MTLAGIDADLIAPQHLAECVIDQLKIERRKPPRNGRPGISAREALQAQWFEVHLIVVAIQNVANGMELSEVDLARVTTAWQRIDFINREALQ